jgi:hypothetical protein
LLYPGGALVLDKKAGLNIVGFKTGYGDGSYCSYWVLRGVPSIGFWRVGRGEARRER